MRVFIVDDEQVSLFITNRMLILEGGLEDKNIHAFLSAKEALLSLSQGNEEHLPDIILLDINMPEMDGWQFLEALQPHWMRLKGRCRICILTSSLDLSDAEKAKENPMVFGFMQKPIGTENIRTLCSPARF